MKREQLPGVSTIQLKVQDATGENLMINRDVLRRTYAAVKELCRHFHQIAVGPDAHPANALSISFIESDSGDVVFIVDELVPKPPTPRRGMLSFPKSIPQRESGQSAAESALRNTVFLAQAAMFVIETGYVRTLATSTPDLVDLGGQDDSQRLRVPKDIQRSLSEANIQESLRELFMAVGEEGVASIVIGLDPDAPERRVEFVIPAADGVLQFLNGAPLPFNGDL